MALFVAANVITAAVTPLNIDRCAGVDGKGNKPVLPTKFTEFQHFFTNLDDEYGTLYDEQHYFDIGYSVQQTTDRGYIVVGYTRSHTGGTYRYFVRLIKTDGNGTMEWNKTFTGLDIAMGYSILQTSDNGYILTGATTSFNETDTSYVLLLKTDSNGNEKWKKTFMIGDGGLGYALQQTSDTGYIIVGYSLSSDLDVLLIKTDSDGIMEWNTTFDLHDYDYGLSVQQTTDTGYLLTGYTMSFGSESLVRDGLLIKTDAGGTEEWNKTFRVGKWSAGYSITEAADNGYVVAGDVAFLDDETTETSVLLVKIDDDGNEEWNATVGVGDSSAGYSIQRTIDNGYIITGAAISFDGALDYNADVLLVKTDGGGNEEWNATFDLQEYYDVGLSVQQTIDTGYIITGATGDIDFENIDVLLIKTDGNGTMGWSKTFGWSWSDKSPPTISITKPTTGLYFRNKKIKTILVSRILILGTIDIEANATDNQSGIENVEFYIDDELKANDTSAPYNYTWIRDRRQFLRHKHVVKVVAYDTAGNSANDEIVVWKFL